MEKRNLATQKHQYRIDVSQSGTDEIKRIMHFSFSDERINGRSIRDEFSQEEKVMKSRKITCVLLASLVLGCGALVADAEDAPKENKGLTASKTTVVDLGAEIEGIDWSAAAAAITYHRTGRLHRYA